MKKILLLSLLSLSLLILGGCTHSIHMVHTDGFSGPMPAEKKAIYVEAKSEQHVILGFVYNTDYVNHAHAALLAQCDGSIRAVSTQFSTSHGFLYWTNKILMNGVCLSFLKDDS
jgi:hypothetical protein